MYLDLDLILFDLNLNFKKLSFFKLVHPLHHHLIIAHCNNQSIQSIIPIVVIIIIHLKIIMQQLAVHSIVK